MPASSDQAGPLAQEQRHLLDRQRQLRAKSQALRVRCVTARAQAAAEVAHSRALRPRLVAWAPYIRHHWRSRARRRLQQALAEAERLACHFSQDAPIEGLPPDYKRLVRSELDCMLAELARSVRAYELASRGCVPAPEDEHLLEALGLQVGRLEWLLEWVGVREQPGQEAAANAALARAQVLLRGLLA